MSLKKIFIYILSLVLLLGCGTEGNFKTSATSKSVTGVVSKGPINGAEVLVRRVDTDEVLGSGTTDDKGQYNIDIGRYSGIVKIVSTGGRYIDEIDNKSKDASDVVLKAISVVDDGEGYTVNVTPFTDIASKKLEALETIDKNSTISENKKVAVAFMGKDFDITKKSPKILNIDTIDDSDEGRYGTMLAVFAKLTDSNSSNVNSKITEFYNDFEQDELISKNISNQIQTALKDTNIASKIDVAIVDYLNNNSKIQESIQIIRDYAQDNSNEAPTLQNYIDAGAEGVTEDLIELLNLQVDQSDVNQTNTITKIQSLVNIAQGIDIISPTLTISDDENGIAIASGGDVTFTFAFSEPVIGFEAEDINVTGGLKDTLTEVNSSTYTISITPYIDSIVDITVGVSENAVKDSFDNNNTVDIQVVQEVDTQVPAFTSTDTVTVAENQISVIDINAIDTVTYTISGTDSDSFDINSSTGVVTFKSTPDYEVKTSYTFIVTVIDENLNQVDQNITVNISDEDENAPTIIISDDESRVANISSGDIEFTFSFSEVVIGFEVGDITVTGGIKGTLIDVNGSTYTMLITPDVNSITNITVDVLAGVVNDANQNNNSSAVQVVQEVDTQVPVFTSLDIATVLENQLNAIDVNAVGTSSYTISGIDSESFNINSITGVVTFKSAPDFETKASYTFTVTATDTNSNEINQSITISIGDEDETLPILTITDDEAGVANIASGDIAFTFTFSEVVIGFASADIEVIGGVKGSLTNSDDLTYTMSVTPETNSTTVIILSVDANVVQDLSGNNNAVDLQAVQIVDREAPVFTSLDTATVEENQLSEIDIDAVGAVSYSISGMDSGSFNINSSTGVVTFKSAPDFETKANYTFTVTATDTNSNEIDQSISISISDADENVPTITITDDESGVSNIVGGDVVFTFTFNEVVTGFAVGDINVTGGVKGTLTNSNGSTYTMPITPDANSTTNITVDVPANVAKDSSDNNNTAAMQAVQTVDTLAPTTLPAPTIIGPVQSINKKPKISGSCTADDTITVYIDGSAIAPTAECYSNSYEITPDSPLSVENHTIAVISTDDANNRSTMSSTTNIQVLSDSTAFITTWKTDNNGTTDDNQIKIGTSDIGYNYYIEWGDGESNTSVTGDINHTYENNGTYTVKISGDFPQIYFHDTGYDNDKLIAVDQWGDNNWTSMFSSFYKCSNVEINTTDIPDLSNVEIMTDMFNGATSFDQNISDWNVSNVTNMANMFEDVNMSVANYDSLLIGWSALTLENNVTFNGGDSQYSVDANASKQSIITNHNWTITDGGQQ